MSDIYDVVVSGAGAAGLTAAGGPAMLGLKVALIEVFDEEQRDRLKSKTTTSLRK